MNNLTLSTDVVVAGLAVVDVLGRIVDANDIPEPGGLKIIESIKLTSGGNVSNICINLAKLGFSSVPVTRIGKDELGRFLEQEYLRFGIDSSAMTFDETEQTSSTIVCINAEGERSFLHTRGCLKNFSQHDILSQMERIAQAGMLALGYLGLLPELEIQLPELLQKIKTETGIPILLDTGGNPDTPPDRIRKILPFIDVFIPSFEESFALTGIKDPGQMIDFYYSCGAPGVVGIKLGRDGCLLSDKNLVRNVPSRSVDAVIDTTGAGDAFISGYLAATIRGFDPFESARIGTGVAADCISQIGASTAVRKFESYVR